MTTATYAPEASHGRSAAVSPGGAEFRLQPLRALRAMRRLLQNKEDTSQVFEIMRSLSGNSIPKGYAKLLKTPRGGAIAYRRQELVEILSDTDFLRSLPEGSVGRCYLNFTTREKISAQGLIEESRKVEDINAGIDLEHPLAWYGRRIRDVHDLWHVLTGYGRDALGEACVVAFSYAQTRSLGFGFIAAAGALKIRQHMPDQPVIGAVWQAYRNGRAANWLPAEDYVSLLAENLDAARARLNIAAPTAYLAVPERLRQDLGSDLTLTPAA